MRVSILTAMSECKTCGIVEATRCAVNYFGNECERLKRARAELFEQQELGEVMQPFFVSNREYRSESFQIDVLLANFMVCRQSQMSRGDDRLLWTIVCDLEERALGVIRSHVDEIHDRALVLAEDCGVWISNEVAD